MKIEQFWNQAFLAALTRLSATEAKEEADAALALCLKHWIKERSFIFAPMPQNWAEAELDSVSSEIIDTKFKYQLGPESP
jgi:hypothetical protein